MAHDVGGCQVMGVDALDTVEDLQGMLQAGRLAARKIDLAGIAGDDHATVAAETRQHHFHLRDRGVLRLVDDHECVLEGASAHEGERGNFDLAACHAALHLFLSHEFAQRIPDWQHVRIDLFFQRAGQEAEFLARFDSRTGHDQALAQSGGQLGNASGDSEKGLARAGRSDTEDKRIV